jgi:hypothetical protein
MMGKKNNRFKIFKKAPKVEIIVPNTGQIKTGTVAWLLNQAWGRPNTNFALPFDPRPTDHNRNSGILQFLEGDAEWAFFLDSDIIPPAIDALDCMLATNKEIVSGVCYSFVANPNRPPGVRIACGHWEGEPVKSRVVFFNTVPETLTEIDVCGGACLLVHRNVIKRVVKEYGCCFRYRYMDGFVILSEDFDFSVKVKELGYKIYMEPKVRCAHLKEMDLFMINRYIWRNAMSLEPVISKVFADDPEMAKSMYERLSETMQGVYDPNDAELKEMKAMVDLQKPEVGVVG